MLVTVAICTTPGNERDLDTAVLSLAKTCRVPAEILIVLEGGPSQSFGESWQGLGLPVRVITQEGYGLSAGRNSAIEHAWGDIVAYIDDDCIIGRTWMKALWTTLRRGCAAGIAGRVFPIFEGRPEGLAAGFARLRKFYSVLDEGPGPLEQVETAVGCNMAFSRSILEKVGGFDESLGRKGNTLLSFEEDDLSIRLRVEGYRIAYDPRMCVRHRIPKERLTLRWCVRRSIWQGVSEQIALGKYQNSPFVPKDAMPRELRSLRGSIAWRIFNELRLLRRFLLSPDASSLYALAHGTGSLAQRIFRVERRPRIIELSASSIVFLARMKGAEWHR